MAYIPYDVFNHIIIYADMKLLLNLYDVNSIIRKLCTGPFMNVLLEFRKNPYFNINATSNQLNDFLNDLTGHDPEMLKDLQLTFGATLMGKNIAKHIIILDGSNNGKSTFLYLIRQLLGYRYVRGSDITDPHIENYRNAYIVNYIEPTRPLNISTLKRLSGGDPFYYKQNYYDSKFTIIIAINQFNIPIDKILMNRFKILTFKTEYLDNGYNYHPVVNEKLRIIDMIDRFTYCLLSAFLNFLLQGCRESIK